MTPRSAKAKGKWLENWVCNKLKELFNFTNDEIRTTVGGEKGADIKLSKKAQNLFPFSIECKNRETFKNIYSAYEQAMKHEAHLEPLVIIKSNRQIPLAIVSAELFFNLIRNADYHRTIL